MGNEEVLSSLPLKNLNSLQTVLLLGGGAICPVLHTRVLLRNIPPEGYGRSLMSLLVFFRQTSIEIIFIWAPI